MKQTATIYSAIRGANAVTERPVAGAHAASTALPRTVLWAAVMAVSVLVSGCATPSPYATRQESPLATDQKPLATSAAALSSAEIEADPVPDPKAIKYRGTDTMIAMPEPEAPVRFVGDAVTLGFENAPLSEVTHAVLSDILGVDYLVDGPIPGQVTLRTRTPIPRNDLLGVLESLLKANNVILVRGRDGRYIVTSSQAASSLAPRVVGPDDLAAGYSTMIVPLQFISAGDMAEILKPLADEKAFVRVDNPRNILMLAGTQNQLRGWLDIVSTFDVDMLAGMSVGLFPLRNSGVDEMVTALNELLMETSGSVGKGGLAQIVRILPFPRLNSILVITPRAHYLERVETWIERIDQVPESGAERSLYVYPVQNTTAARLATLLNSIYSGGSQSGNNNSRQVGDNRSVAPGMSRESIGSSARSGGNSAAGFGSNGGGNQQAAASVTQLNMEDQGGSAAVAEVRVVADDENNSLMIYSTGIQYRLIKAALEKLDTPPTQVLIEASIIEVTLTDELKYGLEWTFNGKIGGSGYNGTGVLSDGSFASSVVSPLGDIANGFSYSITGGAGDIVGVLQALSNESLVNVISSPSVMVLDNNTAYIHVGDQIPVSNGSTVSNGGNVTENISYRDTGVKLNVRPSVNAGGLVTLDVEQSVTDVGQIDVTGNRRFLERNIMSRVAVRSGESVVLGGLIRENAANQDAGLPWLHTMPLIGPLFGTTEKSNNRTELVVIITPRALYNDTELREVSDDMRSQVRNLDLLRLEAPVSQMPDEDAAP